jgi:hypothetical protein
MKEEIRKKHKRYKKNKRDTKKTQEIRRTLFEGKHVEKRYTVPKIGFSIMYLYHHLQYLSVAPTTGTIQKPHLTPKKWFKFRKKLMHTNDPKY